MVSNMKNSRKQVFVRWLMIAFCLFVFVSSAAAKTHAHGRHSRHKSHNQHNRHNQDASSSLKLNVSPQYVDMDNGNVSLRLTLSGLIAGVGYKGIDNVMQWHAHDNRRGYWDIVWSRPGIYGQFDTLHSTGFNVISETIDQIEVSFTMRWNISQGDQSLPLNIDKRFVMRRGVSGFYSYAIFEHEKGWPDLNIDEARIAFKLDPERFQYMAISDHRQRIMPTEYDRKMGRTLAYNEAVLLTNPKNPELKGEVDDKYQYSCDNKDNRVHGWISTTGPHIGFWVIVPSDEFRAGGPVKPDLTSHAGTTSLAVFFSDHYVGTTFGIKLRDGEYWKKVFGPVFIYLNSDSGTTPTTLWEDAKAQLSIETKNWPYDFPLSEDFPNANQRGNIRGRLLIHDRYVHGRGPVPATSAYVGLAPPGDVGSWQDNSKGYQFWTTTDEMGYFTIRGVRPDMYSLYAWVPGFIGDYKYEHDFTVQPGSEIEIGNIVYEPPRNGPTLWEIGIPDRTASEFYVPDASPELTNKLYVNSTTDKFRQYGLWDRYTDLYPTEDLIYTVGQSDYRKDWFFAHVNRKLPNNNYTSTTWQIAFDAENVRSDGIYTLRIALASATFAEVQVLVNNPYPRRPHFTTRRIGRDNAIARHGIHGRYWLYSIDIQGYQLVNGKNTIYLKQSRGGNPFVGVMYDYIRLEGPPGPIP